MFFPPLRWRTWLGAAAGWERIGRRWLQAFSGVIVIEATKQLYGAVPTKPLKRRGRIALPLPQPAVPSARQIPFIQE